MLVPEVAFGGASQDQQKWQPMNRPKDKENKQRNPLHSTNEPYEHSFISKSQSRESSRKIESAFAYLCGVNAMLELRGARLGRKRMAYIFNTRPASLPSVIEGD